MEPAWPSERAELMAQQRALGVARPPPWQAPADLLAVGGVFVCFPCGQVGHGAAGDSGWAGAAVARAGRVLGRVSVAGVAAAPYEPGLLAMREGPLLEAAARALPSAADVLLVNATGHDHPRRAGLALHLGAVAGLPSVGVTHRPLYASGDWPGAARGDTSPLLLEGETVASWLRVRAGARPLVVHPGWRTTLSTAVAVVLAACGGARTPLPLRAARQAAREARALAQGRALGPAGPLTGP
jgi:deoxyribonuclease V